MCLVHMQLCVIFVIVGVVNLISGISQVIILLHNRRKNLSYNVSI